MLRPLLLPLLVFASGCWVDSGTPNPGGGGTCNSNGRCELSLREDAVSCPADCPPCQAIQAHVGGSEDLAAQLALLAPNDSKTISLSDGKTLQIQIGLEVYQSTDGTPDFTLQGTVTSASTVNRTSDGCFVDPAPDQGAFQVDVSKDGTTNWQTVGYWAKTVQGGPGGGAAPGVATFHLCGAGSARYIRIVPRTGAAGTLDYFKADSCN